MKHLRLVAVSISCVVALACSSRDDASKPSPKPVPGAPTPTAPTPTPTPTPTAPTPVQTPPAGGLVDASGHFTAVRSYRGTCTPPGARGGCYSLEFRPDGTYTHVLLDASVHGTYTIAGAVVTLAQNGEAPTTMALSADGLRVGEYAFQATP